LPPRSNRKHNAKKTCHNAAKTLCNATASVTVPRYDLLGRIEAMRDEIEVQALEADFEDIEPDDVVKDM
jgi:hypothetical protein